MRRWTLVGLASNACAETGPAYVTQEAFCDAVDAASCPGDDDSALTHHDGLRASSRCRFELVDQRDWTDREAVVTALSTRLAVVSIHDLLGELDRTGVPVPLDHPDLAQLDRAVRAFRWDDEDFGDAAWMPQGVSGSADAFAEGTVGGREVLAVSWYHDSDAALPGAPAMGARLSFADITDLDDGAVPYGHVLLVEPVLDGGEPSFRRIDLHVGGIAWVGDYLWVADTLRGLRAFDTTRLLRVDPAAHGIGWDAPSEAYGANGLAWVLPEAGSFLLSEQSCWHRFSFVALDSTSEPPSLVTGEYHGMDIAGKVMRWDLDGQRLASDPATGATFPRETWFAQERSMQGAVSVDGQWYLSCSQQVEDGSGLLYRTGPGSPSEGRGWIVGPEDLMYSPREHALWSASEFAGRRYVFSVEAD